MKAYLMHKEMDFNLDQELPSNEEALIQDLELNILFEAMANDDEFIFDIVKRAVLLSESEIDGILYRQEILKDCLKNPSIVREIYQIPIESIENKKRHWLGILSYYPSGVLASANELMQMFVGLLKKLRRIADEHSSKFESEGFKRFFAMIHKELDDDYIRSVEEHLKDLQFRNGVLISAELGDGNEGANYLLRKMEETDRNWLRWVLKSREPSYTFHIHPRDEHGAKALSELTDRGINLVANALAQSADHIDAFFNMLRVELAFYIGCLNLQEKLKDLDNPITFPMPFPSNERRHTFKGLYDICLALTMEKKIIGNDIRADGKDLAIITGANQGGKSTFLRSIGLSQLMMQCGMFVPAEEFGANICRGIYTHYKRKEDATMKSGKLDEELYRMSVIAETISSNAMILFNESFSATNEREGSEIARQITSALLARHIKVFFVTHQYEFSHGFYVRNLKNAIFLRADRKGGGGRTFKLIEKEPLQTSFGIDVYESVFKKEY